MPHSEPLIHMMQDVKNLARSKSAFKLFVGADEDQAGGSGTELHSSAKVMGTAAAVVLDSSSASSSTVGTDQDTPTPRGNNGPLEPIGRAEAQGPVGPMTSGDNGPVEPIGRAEARHRASSSDTPSPPTQ